MSVEHGESPSATDIGETAANGHLEEITLHENGNRTPARVEYTQNKPIGKKRLLKKPERAKCATYEEILVQLSNFKENRENQQKQFFELLDDLKGIKKLTASQVTDVVYRMRDQLENAWIPFMTRVYLELKPRGSDYDIVICRLICQECVNYLAQLGIQNETLEASANDFIHRRDSAVIKELLSELDSKNAAREGQLRDPDQIVSCIAFVFLSARCCFGAYDSVRLQLIIDRAFAEYYSKHSGKRIPDKKLACNVVGSALSAIPFSQKKVAALTFLYDGVTETVQSQQEKIRELQQGTQKLLEQRDFLNERISGLEREKEALTEQIKSLTSANEQSAAEKRSAESMLEYEANKYDKQLLSLRRSLAKSLEQDIGLELQAIRENADYLAPDDQRRIMRRLDRIDRILHESEG